MNKLLTIKQASQILGYKVSKVYYFIKLGKLSAKRVGSFYVLDYSEVHEMAKFNQKVKLKWCTAEHYAVIKNICMQTVHNWIKKQWLDSAIFDGRLYVRKDQGKRRKK